MTSPNESNTDAPFIALSAVPAITKHFQLQFEQAQDSWVLAYPEGMIKLNSSAAEILQRCNGETSIGQMITDIETSFSETGLQADILSFFELASNNNWVTLA